MEKQPTVDNTSRNRELLRTRGWFHFWNHHFFFILQSYLHKLIISKSYQAYKQVPQKWNFKPFHSSTQIKLKKLTGPSFSTRPFVGTFCFQPLCFQVTKALELGAAVFATEWGTCDASGDGTLNLEEAEQDTGTGWETKKKRLGLWFLKLFLILEPKIYVVSWSEP